MKPWSLPKATTDPVSDTEPMTAPSRVAIIGMVGSSSARTGLAGRRQELETATTAAAPPPAPLKMATIWGMAVIGTRGADHPDDRADQPAHHQHPPVVEQAGLGGHRPGHDQCHAGGAEQVPVRAVLGDARNFRARMKLTDATR